AHPAEGVPDVHVPGAAERLPRMPLDRPQQRRGAGVEHQQVRPVRVDELPGQRRVGRVARHRGKRLAELGPDLGELAAVPGDAGHPRPGLGERGGDAAAEPPAGSGHDRSRAADLVSGHDNLPVGVGCASPAGGGSGHRPEKASRIGRPAARARVAGHGEVSRDWQTVVRATGESRSERMVKAVRFSRFGGPEVLEIVDLPDPHPGPGQVRIAVRAAGVNPSDWKKREGLMDPELPQTMGYEAAGVVDELGEGVADVAVGDRVFGLSAEGAAQAELTVLSFYAPIPPSLTFAGAAALPAAVETATRALDQLGVGAGAGRGSTLLINGASGSVGSAAVQLALARGVRVIGTASPANHDYLRALGAEPVAYGEGLAGRVRALAPDGVDAALDVAGSGVLPELIELAGGP